MDFTLAHLWLAYQVHTGGDANLERWMDLADKLQNPATTKAPWRASDLLKRWGVQRYRNGKERLIEDIKADFRQALVKKVAAMIAQTEPPQSLVPQPSFSSAPPPAGKRCANDDMPSEI